LRTEIYMAYHLDTWKGCDRSAAQEPQCRLDETVAFEPQGPSWPRCMRGA